MSSFDMSQQYSLRWNNHQPNFIASFSQLLSTGSLVDVTLTAEGETLPAHKIVLCACSPYFHSVLVKNPSNHPIVILKDVTFAHLQTIVDFMYTGSINVTPEEFPKIMATARNLQIKGLSEMPNSTTLTDLQPGVSVDSQRRSVSPMQEPSAKRKRRRKSSSGSAPVELIPEESEPENTQVESITLSSLPQQQQGREDRDPELAQQSTESQNANVMPQSHLDANSSLQVSIKSRLSLRRTYRRQSRVQSEPGPSDTSPPIDTTALPKQASFPPYDHRHPKEELQVTDLSYQPPAHAQRSAHTPAVRSGPPLRCNFCWNTVDETGRILRRKTQYHCPECRTNLCIVPCFHEYHDGADIDTASTR
ncbi:protein tramtrack, beta isoform-like isoform X2 [Plodia interpunctella]|uniref:protein tramtrack, beta isoform-like isoform X2 n=1 Tax=Plodia interpunctella TaxID=58824 RepID=UPI00310178A0